MKKSDVETLARQNAEALFSERPNLNDLSLGGWLITEEARAHIPWNGHTTYRATFKSTYKAKQEERRSQS